MASNSRLPAACPPPQLPVSRCWLPSSTRFRMNLTSEILGRTFPYMIHSMQVANRWSPWFKKALNSLIALKKPSGVEPKFVLEGDIINNYGGAHVPIYLGGSLDADRHHPEGVGNMVKAWYVAGGLGRLHFLEGSAGVQIGGSDAETALTGWQDVLKSPMSLPAPAASRKPAVRLRGNALLVSSSKPKRPAILSPPSCHMLHYIEGGVGRQ